MSHKPRHRACKTCGARWPFVTISASGQCPDHSRIRMEENVKQMRARSGPNFTRWREAMARSVGGQLLDDAPARE
jgi:hypothetical protein